MKKMLVYPSEIYMGAGLLSSQELIDTCKPKNYRSVLITDSNLANTWAKKLNDLLQIEMLTIPAGESFKTRETKQNLEDVLLQNKYGRDTCMIALGGGVVCDIVGFLASTYCRGVPSIYVPTTLLAMADASIGGKTGVNTVFGKNMIGTFYQPKAVFMDMDTLASLTETEWKNGLAEIIKHALVYDKNLFKKIKDNKSQIEKRDPTFMADLVFESCKIKKYVVESDEKESGLRQILNFGHTIGHGIESFEQYRIGHGQAVAIGMVVESYLSVQCGSLEQSCFEEILQLLNDFEVCLPTRAFDNKKDFIELMKIDKKAIQQNPRFVLLEDIGRVHSEKNSYCVQVDSTLLEKTLQWAAEKFTC